MRDDEALAYWSLYIKSWTNIFWMAVPYVQMYHINGAGAIKRRYMALTIYELEVFSNITSQKHNNSYDINSLPVPADNNTYSYTCAHIHTYIRIYTYTYIYTHKHAYIYTYKHINEYGFIKENTAK